MDTAMPDAKNLIIGSYNVHKGIGRDRRLDPHRTLSVIREIGADILALQEVDRRFGTRQGVLDLDALREATGLAPVPLSERKTDFAHGWHGNLLLVRDAFVETSRVIELPGFEPRGAIVSDVTIFGKPLRLIAAHFGLLKHSRRLQSQRLAAEIGRDRATVMLGDLNEWRKGPGCSLMPLKTGLDAVKSARDVASFPASRPLFSLDKIIGCERAELSHLEAVDTPLSRVASDHLPIRARLRLQ